MIQLIAAIICLVKAAVLFFQNIYERSRRYINFQSPFHLSVTDRQKSSFGNLNNSSGSWIGANFYCRYTLTIKFFRWSKMIACGMTCQVGHKLIWYFDSLNGNNNSLGFLWQVTLKLLVMNEFFQSIWQVFAIFT